jgi:hypothetical protein
MPSARDYRTTAARIHTINASLAASGDLGSITAQESMLDLASGLADDYAAGNPRFDRARFMAACGFAVAAGNVIRPADAQARLRPARIPSTR